MKPRDDASLKVYLATHRKQELQKRMFRTAVVRTSLVLAILWFAVVGLVTTVLNLFN